MGLVEKAGGPLRLVVFIIVGILAFAVVAGGSLWAMDYGVEATIIEKQCGSRGSTVSVQEDVTRLVHTQEVDRLECEFAQSGHQAVYNIRSERLRLFTPDGQCYWDSHDLQTCVVPTVLHFT
jgi:hypothetical protein